MTALGTPDNSKSPLQLSVPWSALPSRPQVCLGSFNPQASCPLCHTQLDNRCRCGVVEPLPSYTTQLSGTYSKGEGRLGSFMRPVCIADRDSSLSVRQDYHLKSAFVPASTSQLAATGSCGRVGGYFLLQGMPFRVQESCGSRDCIVDWTSQVSCPQSRNRQTGK